MVRSFTPECRKGTNQAHSFIVRLSIYKHIINLRLVRAGLGTVRVNSTRHAATNELFDD